MENRQFLRDVNRLCNSLPNLSFAEKEYAKEHCFPNEICLCKESAWCMACGKSFPLSKKDVENGSYRCPHCGKKLRVRLTTKRKFVDWTFYTLIKVVGNYQLLRHFKVYKRTTREDGDVFYSFEEVCQNWVSEDGQVLCTRKAYATRGSYNYAFIYNSRLYVREPTNWRSDCLKIYAKTIFPKMEVLPILRRNGFRQSFHEINPCDLFCKLLSDNISEMLFKTKQYRLLQYSVRRDVSLRRYMPSIRIANRNNYIIKDGNLWIDYLNALIYLGKDVRNAYYVCPPCLEAAHEKTIERKRIVEERNRKIARQKEAKKWEKLYHEHVRDFLGLVLQGNGITIRAIPTVKDVLEEGEAMHHCVYTNGYYKDKDALLMSARKDGERIETIEVNLNTFQVVQSRAVCNTQSESHRQIVDLVNSNMYKIRKLQKNRTV